jgi:predicted transcriptional regulator
MKVLLSIKPQFVDKIFSGQKKYEYRRSIFKREGINKVIIYATAPISQIVGEFEIDKIIFDDVSELWEKTNDHSGINKEFFYKYFSDRNKGYAIKIKSVIEYNIPKNLNETYGVMAPQSFVYIN